MTDIEREIFTNRNCDLERTASCQGEIKPARMVRARRQDVDWVIAQGRVHPAVNSAEECREEGNVGQGLGEVPEGASEGVLGEVTPGA